MGLDPRVKQEPGVETLVPGRVTEAESVSQGMVLGGLNQPPGKSCLYCRQSEAHQDQTLWEGPGNLQFEPVPEGLQCEVGTTSELCTMSFFHLCPCV